MTNTEMKFWISVQGENSEAVDSMSSQGAKKIYEREANIVLDYDGFDDDLKDLDSGDEVKKELERMNKAISDLQATIHRINAPNMKAMEKWVL